VKEIHGRAIGLERGPLIKSGIPRIAQPVGEAIAGAKRLKKYGQKPDEAEEWQELPQISPSRT
jgi:hypothetical protein